MKLLLDFLPIILFFGTFKYAERHQEWAAQFATEHFGFLVSGGVVGPNEGPVLLATLVVIAATLAQVVFMLLRGKKIPMTLWVSLGLVVLLGGATVWFHSSTFIKWKPSVWYWVLALAILFSYTVLKKDLLKLLMGQQIELPPQVWLRLNMAWVAFFSAMGLLNLYVAYTFSFSTWVDFKLFGGIGLMLLFVLLQGVYMSRHMKPQDGTDTPQQPKLPS
jgi:intracellular septation protein